MIINFTPVDPGTRYPPAIIGQDTADLVDVHFAFSLIFPEHIDLVGNRERLFADHQCVKVLIYGAPEPVNERLDGIFG